MKIHYDASGHGTWCHTGRARRTSHDARVTKVRQDVTCLNCRKMWGINQDQRCRCCGAALILAGEREAGFCSPGCIDLYAYQTNHPEEFAR